MNDKRDYITFILIALIVLGIGHLSGVWTTEARLDRDCEKEMLYTDYDGQEYACHKMPGVITKEEANALR